MIIKSVESFQKQDYPQDKYQVVVVTDHMNEETNRVLAQLPITLFIPDFQAYVENPFETFKKLLPYLQEELNVAAAVKMKANKHFSKITHTSYFQ